jgi:L-ascorbate metabolism protein UlaG (beta-lactamase superfamily)
MGLIPAYCKGEELLRQIRQSRTSKPLDHFDLWWLGQSGVLISWNGRCLLFDPYLSDSLTRKYANTDQPHVRMSEQAIDPSKLDCIDMVTSSHNHTDHLDAETLKPLIKANPGIEFVIPEANREFVCARLGCDADYPIGLTDGESLEIRGFEFFGVPAAHPELERNERGECVYMGYVVRFGKWSVYHSGDTLLYDGMEDILSAFDLDVALLPINGNVPERRVAGNLNAREAAELGKAVGAKLVIPHHFHMFEFNSEDPARYEEEAQRVGQAYRVLRVGERVRIGS